MSDPVWQTIDDALARMRPRRFWADLARHLDMSEQRVNNWKRRRVPADHYPEIASFLGMSVEDLLAGGHTRSVREARAGYESPATPADDDDRHLLLLGDLDLLEAAQRFARPEELDAFVALTDQTRLLVGKMYSRLPQEQATRAMRSLDQIDELLRRKRSEK